MFKNAERNEMNYSGEMYAPIRWKLERLGSDQAKMKGVKGGYGKIINEDERSIVISFKGYGYNSGSRYSRLKAYQPAETFVLMKGEDDWWYYLTSYENRKPKKVINS